MLYEKFIRSFIDATFSNVRTSNIVKTMAKSNRRPSKFSAGNVSKLQGSRLSGTA
jgi:hypothetical protein